MDCTFEDTDPMLCNAIGGRLMSWRVGQCSVCSSPNIDLSALIGEFTSRLLEFAQI